jgi:radical SAM superfamily enzyme YgiQ (UPF0313 family)
VVAESEAIRLFAEHAPIGILSLAAVLEQRGTVPQVVDLNRLYYHHLRSEDSGDFGASVTSFLESLRCDVYGFGTLCNSYPLTIRVARELKSKCPSANIVLGGPQASVVDVETMKAFRFIDFVIRGEAEETLPLLLEAISDAKPYDSIPGITFRCGETIIRNPPAPVILDLDTLPMPAFHLYPELNDCRYIPLELGRGCPFACRFCSTNDFFRRRFRVKSPQPLIQQMRELKNAYGIEWFDLIHDMFTVDRKKVAAFCEAMLASGERFYWNCSARTDCIDDELIALMAKAGCRNIFFGIESGSSRIQQVIDKHLDLSEARSRIRCTTKHKIMTTVSLITGFAEETREDLKSTISFLMDSLRSEYVKPQLHLLAPLAETPIYSQFRDRLRLDEVFSDISYEGWRQNAADRALIESHPEIFPNFYAVPTLWLDRRYLKDLRDFVLHGIVQFRWLLVALHQSSGDLVEVFDAWRSWRSEKGSVVDGQVPYYARIEFVRNFLNFAHSWCTSQVGRGQLALSTLIDCMTALHRVEPGDSSPTELRNGRGFLDQGAVPCLAPGVYLVQLGANYKTVIRCLKRKGRLERIASEDQVIATRQSTGKRAEVLQLSKASAQLLRLCDGRRTTKEIAERFSSVVEDMEPVKGVSPEKVCIMGLELLREQRLIDT